jgi:hypothetical protein
MLKTAYFRDMYKRQSFVMTEIKKFIYSITTNIRFILEVLIRSNMGERHFSVIYAVFVGLILYFIPFAYEFSARHNSTGILSVIWDNITWYIFIGYYAYCCMKRKKELVTKPGVFDFARMSYSTGHINRHFLEFKVFGKKRDYRFIETFLEPLFFLVIGIALLILGQKVGMLILICSMCYSISYYMAYRIGDDIIMDNIDIHIVSKEMTDLMSGNDEETSPFGNNFRAEIPKDKANRKSIFNDLGIDDDFASAE